MIVRMFFLCLWATLVVSLVSSVWAAPSRQGTAATQRAALIVASNDGGPTKQKLRFAGQDALTFAGVLQTLGDLRPEEETVLLEPTVADFRAAVQKTLRRLRLTDAQGVEAPRKRELIFYYSGHSDAEGLLLKDGRIAYAEVRRLLVDTVGTPADIRIAIVDACASGALARDKGGVFHKPLVIDKEFNVRGYAILTSSSANEVSQESDALQGSYFTNALVAGLRGAADRNRDERVTLGEAYQYAFDETVRRSAKSLSGGQHPHYALQMSGAGDVVLTRMQDSAANLEFAPEAQGQIRILRKNGTLLTELHKPAGDALRLQLEAGEYRIEVVPGGDKPAWKVSVSLQAGQRLVMSSQMPSSPTVTVDSLAPTKVDSLTLINPEPDTTRIATDLAPPDSGAPFTPARIGVFPRIAWPYFGSTHVQAGLAFDAVGGVHQSTAISLATLFNVVDSSVAALQFAAGFNVGGVRSRGLQVSAFANQAERHQGVQVGLVYNGASEKLHGLQACFGVNHAHEGSGVQIAALNLVGYWQGVQIGLLNVADTLQGLQLGVINRARSNRGLSLGLFSFVEDGLLHLQLQRDYPIEAYHAIFQTGGKWNYNLVQATYARREGDRAEILSAYYGLGFQLPIRKAYAEWDIAAGPVFNITTRLTDTDGAMQSRLSFGFAPVKRFGVFTGLALNGEIWAAGKQSNFDVDDAGNRLNVDLRYRVKGRWFLGVRI
jgi:Caspase domain